MVKISDNIQHEKTGDGKSALDFLKEISNKKWRIITNEILEEGGDVFCPYFYKGELGCETHEEASEKLLGMLPTGRNLFIHHAISGSKLKGIMTDELNEVVLKREVIIPKYNNIICGHIHSPHKKAKDKVVYAGSVFTNEVGEEEKFVYTMEDGVITPHKLPCRSIVKLENPTAKEIEKYDSNSILKIILSNKVTEEELIAMKGLLSPFDGSILVEDYKTERKIIKFADGELDLNISNLIDIYAKEKKIDAGKLKAGYELIKK